MLKSHSGSMAASGKPKLPLPQPKSQTRILLPLSRSACNRCTHSSRLCTHSSRLYTHRGDQLRQQRVE